MRKIQCVFCDSAEVEFFSLYGQTLLGSQYYCRNCKSIFEVVRFDDEDLEPQPPGGFQDKRWSQIEPPGGFSEDE